MRTISFIAILLSFISCNKNTLELDELKYSKNDVIPLDDAEKSLYYNDAAYIEFRQMIKDTVLKYQKVLLNGANINSYYQDLINIYNNSYSISNSFFENISSIHCSQSRTLYAITASVDTFKTLSHKWINGEDSTGIEGIDSLIENYKLDISFIFRSHEENVFSINSTAPINFYALIEKIKQTNEFKYVEPEVLTGGGSSISFNSENTDKIYKYSLGWGDCPSGCTQWHCWKIKINNNQISLLEEYGDQLE